MDMAVDVQTDGLDTITNVQKMSEHNESHRQPENTF